jgi:hypothetical protein
MVPKTPSLQATIVAAQAGPYTSALHLTVTPTEAESKHAFSLSVFQHAPTPPALSDAVVLRVWMRSPDNTCISVRAEQHEPCRPLFEEMVNLKPTWKEYQFRGHRIAGPPMDHVCVKFQLGACPGNIEITGVCLSIEAVSSVR